MPRWASRTTLLVTTTRRERVRAISEDDARAEGIGVRGTGSMKDLFRDQIFSTPPTIPMTSAGARSNSMNGLRLLWPPRYPDELVPVDVNAEVANLSVERRATDAKPAGDLRHLAVVTVQRDSDCVILNVAQCTH